MTDDGEGGGAGEGAKHPAGRALNWRAVGMTAGVVLVVLVAVMALPLLIRSDGLSSP